MKKISIMLVVTMLMSVFSFGTLSVNATGEENVITADTSWYGGETATEFLLADAGDLLGFADLVNKGDDDFSGKTVKLTADIDMTGVDYTPIGWYNNVGNTGNAFSGTFDGNGKTVSNVTVSNHYWEDAWTSANYRISAGFFGYLSGATVKNLGIKNEQITLSNSEKQASNMAGLAAVAGGGTTVDGCFVSGLKIDVSNTNRAEVDAVGGLMARLVDGDVTISNAYVNGFDKVRLHGDGKAVTAVLGSFIGSWNSTGTLTITDCYAGPVKEYAAYGNPGSKITSYWVGHGWTKAVTVNSIAYVPYWDTTANGIATNTKAYSMTAAELGELSVTTLPLSFKNKYMTDHRNINGGYPILVSNAVESSPFATGTGTAADPYVIDSESSLRDFAKAVNKGYLYSWKHVKLAKDINLAYGDWTPVGFLYDSAPSGGSVDDRAFKGVFDGDGHVVSNVNITRTSANVGIDRKSLGFFGGLGGSACLKNFGIENVHLNLTDTYVNQITDIGCLVGATYTNDDTNDVDGSTILISNCFVKDSKVTIGKNSATNNTYDQAWSGIAPIVGYVRNNADIMRTYSIDFKFDSSANADDSFYLAGLLGRVNNQYIKVYDCYSTGVNVEAMGTKVIKPASMIFGWNVGKTSNLYTTQETTADMSANKGTVTVVTEADLKALTGVAANLAAYYNVAKYGLNNGYPMLKAEKLWVFNRTGNNIALSVKGTHVEGTKLILAVYDGERFVDASIVSTGTTLATDLDLSAGAYNVKGFLWDANLSPLETIPYENTVTVQ